MITQELVDYIKAELAKGIPSAQIEQTLTGSGGWDKRDVSQALKAVGTMGASIQQPAVQVPLSANTMESAAENLVQYTQANPVTRSGPRPIVFWVGLIALLGAIGLGIYTLVPLLLVDAFTDKVLFAKTAGVIAIAFVLAVITLHFFTKIFRLARKSWGRAVFTMGVPSLVAVGLNFGASYLTLSLETWIVSVIIAGITILLWLIIFMKSYKVGFGKTLAIALLQIILTAAIVIALILAFFGIEFVRGPVEELQNLDFKAFVQTLFP